MYVAFNAKAIVRTVARGLLCLLVRTATEQLSRVGVNMYGECDLPPPGKHALDRIPCEVFIRLGPVEPDVNLICHRDGMFNYRGAPVCKGQTPHKNNLGNSTCVCGV